MDTRVYIHTYVCMHTRIYIHMYIHTYIYDLLPHTRLTPPPPSLTTTTALSVSDSGMA